MKFLLVVFMYIIGPDGNTKEAQVVTKPFFTAEQCNEAGRNLRKLTKTDGPEFAHIKTLSYCASIDEFKAQTS